MTKKIKELGKPPIVTDPAEVPKIDYRQACIDGFRAIECLKRAGKILEEGLARKKAEHDANK